MGKDEKLYYITLLTLSFFTALIIMPSLLYIIIPARSGIISYLSLMLSYPLSLFVIDSAAKKSSKRGIKEEVGILKRAYALSILTAVFIMGALSSILRIECIERSSESMSLITASALISILFIPIQAFLEEFIFRILPIKISGGFEQKGWVKALTVAITSALFSLMHLRNPEAMLFNSIFLSFSYYFLSGAFLMLLSYAEGGYTSCISYHAANNLFIAIVIQTKDTSAIPSFPLFYQMKKEDPLSLFLSLFATAFVITSITLIIKRKERKKENINGD